MLRRTGDAVLRAHDRRTLPHDELVHGLDPARELRPHPLEQVYFNLLSAPPAEARLSRTSRSPSPPRTRDRPAASGPGDRGSHRRLLRLRHRPDRVPTAVHRRAVHGRRSGEVAALVPGGAPADPGAAGPPALAPSPTRGGEEITRATVPRPRPAARPTGWRGTPAGSTPAAPPLGGGRRPGHRSGEFFQDGRTDVDAAVLLSRMEHDHDVRIALTDFLRTPTITTLVTAWAADTAHEGARMTPATRRDTALWTASKTGDSEAIHDLAPTGEELAARDEAGWSALDWAAGHGDPATVTALLDAGADPRATGADERPPYETALAAGHREAARILRERARAAGDETTAAPGRRTAGPTRSARCGPTATGPPTPPAAPTTPSCTCTTTSPSHPGSGQARTSCSTRAPGVGALLPPGPGLRGPRRPRPRPRGGHRGDHG
ncbi:hypothetical protein NKH77_07370 [Streptomyces sp. M19]